MRRYLLLVLLLGCPTAPTDDDTTLPADDDSTLPASFSVDVQVQVAGAPVEGAWVLQGGSLFQPILTGPDGRATVVVDGSVEGGTPWVIAALPDHRSVGTRIDEVPAEEILLELTPVEVDNPDYGYSGPGTTVADTTAHCSHCHITLVTQFLDSRHNLAASDPVVHDLYAGTAGALTDSAACEGAGGRWLPGTLPGGLAGERCYLGQGLLPDTTPGCGDVGEPACDDPTLPAEARPTEFGACADCHAPAIPGPTGGGHDLLSATGPAHDNGVHCDFCHKVRDVLPEERPGIAGRLSMGRPLEVGGSIAPWVPVMYGPYPDVVNGFMGGVWAPVFSEARFCSGCHEGDQGALLPGDEVDPLRWPEGRFPVHSTYSEWAEGPLAASTPCQSCHMTPFAALNGADFMEGMGEPGAVFGFLRPAGAVRNHRFPGPLDTPETGPPLVQIAAAIQLAPTRTGDELTVVATLTNTGAGHAIPTGDPLRSIVLIAGADCGGAPLQQTAGSTVTGLGGAWAEGEVGDGILVGDDGAGCATCLLIWDDLPSTVPAAEDLTLRVARSTGSFQDYDGPLDFAQDGRFSPEEKGLPEVQPRGAVDVVETGPGWVQVGLPIGLADGDHVFLSARTLPDGGEESEPVAGAPGGDWGRVLADGLGRWPVPHYRAVDVLRDNRVSAGGASTLSMTWDVTGCGAVTVSARALYRRFPPQLARERGWAEAEDHLLSASEILVQP